MAYALFNELLGRAASFDAFLKAAPGQPRVPAGSPKGGQWTSHGGGGAKEPGWLKDWAASLNPNPYKGSIIAPQYGIGSAGKPAAPPKPPAQPTAATGKATWHDAQAVAVFDPKGSMPKALNGVPLGKWTPPADDAGWAKVKGQKKLADDGPIANPQNKRVGSGVIIREPDGRVWVTEPTNHFGGYENTFPKGGVEKGLSLQANAIKEAYEETGLKVRITGVLADVDRDTSVARYYTAVRVGGTPRDAGWETWRVKLAPVSALAGLMNRDVDKELSAKIAQAAAGLKKSAGARLFDELLDRAVSFAEMLKAYNPGQPRAPAGSPIGGQWVSSASAGGLPAAPQYGNAATNSAAAWATKKMDAMSAMAQAGDLAGLKALDTVPKSKAPNKYQKDVHAHHKALVAHLEAKALAPTAGPLKFDAATWQKLSGPLGSNPGGKFKAPDGTTYYVKFSKSNDHAKNEVLAARLYEAAGAPVSKYHLVDLGDGKLGTATEWKTKEAGLDPSNAFHKAAASTEFATHVWTGNWDAVGLGFDNLAMQDGKLTTIDVGGALLYRAQGQPKGAAWNGKADEWDSLRDPKINPQTAAVFGAMTADQLQVSAAKVAAVSPDAIQKLVDEFGPGDATAKMQMRTTLIARRHAIMQKAAALDSTAALQQAAKAATIPAPPPSAPLAALAKPAFAGKGNAKWYDGMADDVAAAAAKGDQDGVLKAAQPFLAKPHLANTANGTKFAAYIEQAKLHAAAKAPDSQPGSPAKTTGPASMPKPPVGIQDNEAPFVAIMQAKFAEGDAAYLQGFASGVKKQPAVWSAAMKAYADEMAAAATGGMAKPRVAKPPAAAASKVGPALPEKPIIKSAANLSQQKKFDQLEALAASGDLDGLKAYAVTGTNSYSKMAMKYQSSLIAALEGGAAPPKVSAATAASAAAFTSPKGKTKPAQPPKGTFNAAMLPKPPDFENWNGAGKGLSSKPEVNADNAAKVAELHKLAQAGDRKALKHYTSNAAFSINAQMGEKGAIPSAAPGIQAALDKAPELPEGTYLRRGISLSSALRDKLAKLPPGTILQSPHFESTAKQGAGFGGNVEVRIVTAPGVRGWWMGKNSNYPGEGEMILPANTRYAVASYKQQGPYGSILEVVALPSVAGGV